MTDEIDFLAILDAEISQVISKADLVNKRKLAVTKVNSTRSTSTTRAFAKIEIADLNHQIAALQWKVIGTVALFTEQHCDNCGSDHRVFLQYMEKLETNFGPKVERLSRVPKPHLNLPRSVHIQHTITHNCYDCCGELGFDLGKAERRLNGQPFGLSRSYIQEEIEA